MLIVIYIYIFIIGLIIGSFINAYEYRTENELSINGRSFCPNCKHKISWYDLVPILSWLSLKGRCRYCKKVISIQYPIVELITGFSFLIIAAKTPYLSVIVNNMFNKSLCVALISLLMVFYIAFTLIFNSLYDFKTGYLLTKHIYIAIFLSFILLLINYNGPLNMLAIGSYLTPNLLSAVFPAGFFFLLSLVSKEKWMGWGDADLAFLIGLFLGFPNIAVSLYFAFIVGTVYGLVRMIRFKSKVNNEVPFGPMLVAGTFFALLFGSQLASIYVRIFIGG